MIDTVKLLTWPLTKFRVSGFIVQVACAGAPEQAMLVMPLSPGEPASNRLYVAVWPLVTVADVDPPDPGLILNAAETPLPDSAIFADGVDVSLVTVRVPVSAPTVNGSNVMVILQEDAGARALGQVFVCRKPVDTAIFERIAGWPPLFVTVTSCAGEEAATVSLPKLRVDGEIRRLLAGGTTIAGGAIVKERGAEVPPPGAGL